MTQFMLYDMVSFSDIQRALERCMLAAPPSGIERKLSHDASILADILGEMIYRRLDAIPLKMLSERHRETYRRWDTKQIHLDDGNGMLTMA